MKGNLYGLVGVALLMLLAVATCGCTQPTPQPITAPLYNTTTNATTNVSTTCASLLSRLAKADHKEGDVSPHE